MRIPVHKQTQEVAGGRSATPAQPRHATSSFTLRRSSSHGPHPDPRVSATGTTGAPREGLRCRASARSQKHQEFVGKPFEYLTGNRGIYDDR